MTKQEVEHIKPLTLFHIGNKKREFISMHLAKERNLPKDQPCHFFLTNFLKIMVRVEIVRPWSELNKTGLQTPMPSSSFMHWLFSFLSKMQLTHTIQFHLTTISDVPSQLASCSHCYSVVLA